MLDDRTTGAGLMAMRQVATSDSEPERARPPVVVPARAGSNQSKRDNCSRQTGVGRTSSIVFVVLHHQRRIFLRGVSFHGRVCFPPRAGGWGSWVFLEHARAHGFRGHREGFLGGARPGFCLGTSDGTRSLPPEGTGVCLSVRPSVSDECYTGCSGIRTRFCGCFPPALSGFSTDEGCCACFEL